MTYAQAVQYIKDTEKFGIKPGLDSIKRLLEKLGNPESKLKVIHIAGTNGKGSTASFIKSMLTQAGYRVGFYTSPSLYALEERIQINQELIGKEDFSSVVERVKKAVDELIAQGHDANTEFEIFTAMALLYFERKSVDFVVLEVGLGGRLDATNVVDKPLATVITPIALDHTNILGDTLEAVAFEKSGIIKKGVPVIVHPQKNEAYKVIEDIADRNDAQMIIAPVAEAMLKSISLEGTTFEWQGDTFELSMIGHHQMQNAVVALSVIKTLQSEYDVVLKDADIKRGLKATKWPCRLEVVDCRPMVILDGAHNPHGARALAKTLEDILTTGKKPVILMGMLADKDVKEVIEILHKFMNKVVVTEPDSARRLPAQDLAERLNEFGIKAQVESSIELALSKAQELTADDEILLIFGSFYLVGQIRQILYSH